MRNTLRSILFVALLMSHMATAQAFSLFGPSVEKLEPAQVQERLRSQPLAVASGNGREKLAVRTKGAAIGGLVAGLVLGMAAGAGGAPQPGQTAQQFAQSQQEMMEFATVVSQEVSQATSQAINAQVEERMRNHSFHGPAEAMRWLLTEQAAAQLQSQPKMSAPEGGDKDVRYVLSVDQLGWLLDFRLSSALYDLKYNIQTRIYDREKDTYVLSQGCEGSYQDAYELEVWEADNRNRIFSALESVARQCTSQVLAALDMKLEPVSKNPPAVGPEQSSQPHDALKAGLPATDPLQPAQQSAQLGGDK